MRHCENLAVQRPVPAFAVRPKRVDRLKNAEQNFLFGVPVARTHFLKTSIFQTEANTNDIAHGFLQRSVLTTAHIRNNLGDIQILESSADLKTWTPIQTSSATGSTLVLSTC
jgi:hypothetical protein